MSGLICPSPMCDWHAGLRIDDDQSLVILARRDEGDARFDIYVSPSPRSVHPIHVCGDHEVVDRT